MRVAAVVPAAGRGERLGHALPKSLVPLAGLPLVAYAVRGLFEAGVSQVVVAAPPDAVDSVAAVVPAATVVAGGATRQESVRIALEVVEEGTDIVLVHDAARPLTPSAVIRRVVDAVEAGADAVVPVLLVADTVKGVDAAGMVVETVDRSALRAAQTPQGFRRTVLERAHARTSGSDSTDDAGLVEALGVEVHTVEGAQDAFKVTTAWDFAVAEALLTQRGRQ
jgi:2-C-methyl-D-erythritol 4-phosphate cytidylyltransferase